MEVMETCSNLMHFKKHVSFREEESFLNLEILKLCYLFQLKLLSFVCESVNKIFSFWKVNTLPDFNLSEVKD